jgi:DNA-binding MarR family transcriptional regulator
MAKKQAAPPGDGERHCHCTQLRKATRCVSQLYDTILAPGGLKTTQRAILAHIRRAERTTVGQLADALVMDSGALAHTLKPLEREGYVMVEIDPDDRRNRLISLTRSGKAKLDQTDLLWQRAQQSFETAFGKENAQTLRRAMKILISDDFVSGFEKNAAMTSDRST